MKMKQKEEEGQEAANSTNVTPKPCLSPSSISSRAQTSLLTAWLSPPLLAQPHLLESLSQRWHHETATGEGRKGSLVLAQLQAG